MLCLRRAHLKLGHPAELLLYAIVETQTPQLLVRLGRPEGWEPLAVAANSSKHVASNVPSLPLHDPGGWWRSATLH